MSSVLQRTTLRTSRLLDFATEQSLVTQIGHPPDEWPLVIGKELIDNALDAAEESGVAPVIEVAVGDGFISIADNGPGIPEDVIQDVLDFSIRVSSREAYVSPTRGRQGNALKTIVAMPFVLHGERGRIEIEAHGIRHVINMSVDSIRQMPVIDHQREPSDRKNGTSVTVRWPISPRCQLADAKDHFLQVVCRYPWLNPHVGLTIDWCGERTIHAPTNPAWQKWKPSDPTSAHWYDEARLTRLIAGYIAHDADGGKDRTVRELVGEFRGLSSTAKQKEVLEATGLSREHLSKLVVDGKAIEAGAVTKLLSTLRANSKPVKPAALGLIGEEHIRKQFETLAGFEPESFAYKRVLDVDAGGIPSVVEVAFGWLPGSTSRRLVTGVNWSPAIGANPFRNLWGGASLDSVLTMQQCRPHEPVTIMIHMARARVDYIDAGKSAVTVGPDLAGRVIDAVEDVTKRWAKQKRAEDRHKSAEANRRAAILSARRKHVSIRAAAWQVMEEAYLKAAGNAKMANARQIMYAARPSVQRLSDKEIGGGFDHYFTQVLLPNYLAAHPDKCKDWDVLYDKRGNFTEPHGGENVPLGTLEVRKYLARIGSAKLSSALGEKPKINFNIASANYPVIGPKDRYGAVLFIEKEGFDPILKGARIDSRYDIAITSTKGMSVTAFRELVEKLSAMDITTFLLTDFDRSGIINAGTLQRNTRRFAFKGKPKVIHIGLRLEDVAGLETETVVLDGSPDAIARNLKLNGATEDEIKFLTRERKRVELNAMTSDQFIAFVERKLDAHGVQKVIPDDAILTDAYRRFHRMATVQAAIDEAIAKLDVQGAAPVDVPAGLRERIAADLDKHRMLPWDWALSSIVKIDRKKGGAA